MTAIVEPQVDPKPTVPAPPPPTPPADRSAVDPRPTRLHLVAPAPGRIRGIGAAMVVLFVVAVAVQPAPDGPDPYRPLWASALDTVSTFALLALFVGTLAARRWAVGAGMVAGAAGFALSVSCPLSGHHDYAPWWGVQLAALAAMTLLPLALRRQSR